MSRRRTYSLAIFFLLVLFACRSDDDKNAGDVLKAFLDEFYLGRAQSNIAPVLSKYTEWPEFAVGDGVQIATDLDIRLLSEAKDEARFEVRFKVIGEESLAKIEAGQTEVVQTYRLRRRRNQWRILEPIYIPCISVEGELTRLRSAIEDASNRIAKDDFTEMRPRAYFETLISNAQESIALLEKYR